MIRSLYQLKILLLLLVLQGCGRSEVVEFDYSAQWRYAESEIDGIRVIQTLNGSVWRGEASLVEEVSIGVVSGEEPYLFGRIGGLAVGPDRIFILDSSIPALRMYDGDGSFIMDIGVSGGGPGEFLRPDGFAVHPVDGRLYLRDTSLSRVNIWSSTGEYLGSVRVNRPTRSPSPFVITTNGDILTYGRWSRATRYGMIGYNSEGATGDTIPQPRYDYKRPYLYAELDGGTSFINIAVPFSPEIRWVLSPTVALIHGLSDTYSFKVISQDDEILIIEHAGPLVLVDRAEANWLTKAYTLYFRDYLQGWTWDVSPIPDWKPAYKQLQPDLSGRIWVHRLGRGHRIPDSPEEPTKGFDLFENPGWEDTKLIDVFEESGRYLGPVQVSPGFRSAPYIKDDIVLAITTGKEGILVVKKYRLVPPN